MSFDVLGDEWNGLLSRSATDTLFLTREWQRVWWQGLGEGQLQVICIREDDDSLIGIAPLFVEEDALGSAQVQFIGCKEVSDYLDFIFAWARAGMYAEVLAYLNGPEVPRWDAMSFCNVPESSPTRRFSQNWLMDWAGRASSI